MTSPLSHKLTVYIANAAKLPIEHLAQQHLSLVDELIEISEPQQAEAARRLLAAVDAIGLCRFPDDWIKARDGAGLNQDVTAARASTYITAALMLATITNALAISGWLS